MAQRERPVYPAMSDTFYLIDDLRLRVDVLKQHVTFHVTRAKNPNIGIAVGKELTENVTNILYCLEGIKGEIKRLK